MQLASDISDLTYPELKTLITSQFDLTKVDDAMKLELVELLELKKQEYRRSLWKEDISIWAVDRMNVPETSFQWSKFGKEYETHEWDSQIYTRVYDKDAEAWKYPGKPIKDPFHEASRIFATTDKCRMIIPAGTGVGKTWWAAYLVYWWLDVFQPDENDSNDSTKCLYFANKIAQLRINIGSEIESLLPTFKKIHPNAVYARSDVAVYPDNRGESARDSWMARGWGSQTKSGDEASGGSKGIHARNLLLIQEEVQSAEPSILKSQWDGLRGSNNKWLGIGNPLGEYDQAYRAATMPNTVWISVSALDFPNVVLDEEIISGATSRIDVNDTLDRVEGDVEHADYKGPIRGRFPSGGTNSIISASLSAKLRPHQLEPKQAMIYQKHEGDDIEGYTAIYKQPRTDYINWCIMAMDLAGDKVDGDWHVCSMFDRVTREFFGIIKMRGDRVHFFNEVVKRANEYGTRWAARNMNYLPLLSFESNFHSPSRISVIGQYPNLYRATSMDKTTKRPKKTVGFHTNVKTRFEIQERLREWLAEVDSHFEESGGCHKLYLKDLHFELGMFVAQKKTRQDMKTKFAAAPGYNDDCVMSAGQCLAIDAENEHKPPIPTSSRSVAQRMAESGGAGQSIGYGGATQEDYRRMAEYSTISRAEAPSGPIPQLSKYKPQVW